MPLVRLHVAFLLAWTLLGWHLVSKRKEVDAASPFKACVQQSQNVTFAVFYGQGQLQFQPISKGWENNPQVLM